MAALAPIYRNLNWFIGESKTFDFGPVKQADDVTIQNISGWALEWVLRPSETAGVAVITKATGGAGVTITNGAGGLCSVAIVRSDTLTMPPGIYAHALRRTDGGSEQVVSYGPAVLRFAATR